MQTGEDHHRSFPGRRSRKTLMNGLPKIAQVAALVFLGATPSGKLFPRVESLASANRSDPINEGYVDSAQRYGEAS